MFCGGAWQPGKVRHWREHIWSEWIREHAGQLAAERWPVSVGVVMSPHGRSFTEAPLVVTRGEASVLTLVTREACQQCNNAFVSGHRRVGDACAWRVEVIA